ncbi:hypothetical protein [Chthonobacter rhizosphaerae]|uniref:hypothetical protein n=1 Tax=Chthonobacter rhizosphaerae TaxID=2735553 RepID=UPI0015EEA946|nr:hypothetical protein [Chthonobacter rhizosphaerae]
MGLLDLFRRPAEIRDGASLDVFIGEQTAFLVQKSTWEYSRARSGVLWQKLFHEEAFKTAVQASTWANYPLALAFVGEMAAATLRGRGLDPALAVSGVAASCRRIIASQPQPAGFEPTFWAEAERFVSGRLNRTMVAPPKAVKDIPLDGHQLFHERLPMHPDLTKHDKLLLQSTLRVHLCRAHEVMLERLNQAALAQAFEAEVEGAAR